MKVSEIGEFKLIEILAEMVKQARDKEAPSWQNLIMGIGDDTAVWRGDTSTQLATVDSFVQGVHFTTDIFPWEEVGWKALAVNLSDIAAMGGSPRYALVALSLPGDTDVEDVMALYRGMLDLAKQSGVAIAGGNISSAPVVVIDVTVFGNAEGKSGQVLTRSAARPGDVVAVTGYPGTASAGFEVLKNQPGLDPGVTSFLTRAFLHPVPRLVEGRVLLRENVRAAIDISDGLVADLRHICQMSKVGARVNVDSVPIHPLVKSSFKDRSLVLALSGGEDYELLFTARRDIVEKVKAKVSCPVTVIGEVTKENAGEVVLVGQKGETVVPEGMGWDHFKVKG